MKTKMVIAILLTMFLAFTMFSVAPVYANAVPSIVWLPPLSNQELFQLKDGSTVPIKFTLLSPEGSFVSDTNVRVTVNHVQFRDDFEAETVGYPASKWSVVTGTWLVEQEADGNNVYSQSEAPTGRVTYAYWDGHIFTDGIIEAKVKSISGTRGQHIAWRSDGGVNSNYYWFGWGFSPDRVRWGKFVGGVGTEVAAISRDFSSGVWYTLKVVASVSHFDMYLDGERIFSVDDNTFSSGSVGFHCGDHTHFDDFLVLDDAIKEFTYGEGDDNVRIYEDDTIFSDTFSAEGGTQPDQTWEVISGEWEVLDYEYQQTGNWYIPGARAFAGDTAWTDYTMMIKVKIADDGWGGLLLRGNAAGDTYYELYLQRGGNLQLVKTVTGTRVGIMNPYVGGFADQYWYIKAQVVDNVVRGKAWPCSGSEPATWLVEWTDSSSPITSGRIGLITFSWWESQLPVWFDDVTVTVQVGYYIANLHTKELDMQPGEYIITVWYQGGQYQIEDTYLFELTDIVQGSGRGRGKGRA